MEFSVHANKFRQYGIKLEFCDHFNGKSFEWRHQSRFLWPGAVPLCDYLTCNPHIINGHNVVELGAGVGLVAAFIMRFMNPCLITVTEFSDESLKLIERNLNSNEIRTGERCQLLSIEWDDSGLNAKLFRDKRIDVVVGSDLFWDEQSLSALLNCLRCTVPGTIIILAVIVRSQFLIQLFCTELFKRRIAISSEYFVPRVAGQLAQDIIIFELPTL